MVKIQKYIVQCTRGKPELECYFDCSEPLGAETAKKKAETFKSDSEIWMGGKIGRVRIVKAENANCKYIG